MVFVFYFVIGLTYILSFIGLIHGPDKTIPTPDDDWKNATVGLLIPSFNEENIIVLCLASIREHGMQHINWFWYAKR